MSKTLFSYCCTRSHLILHNLRESLLLLAVPHREQDHRKHGSHEGDCEQPADVEEENDGDEDAGDTSDGHGDVG